jgi:hypothetical protein
MAMPGLQPPRPIPIYVSSVIMWRRDPDTANCAAMTNFVAT